MTYEGDKVSDLFSFNISSLYIYKRSGWGKLALVWYVQSPKVPALCTCGVTRLYPGCDTPSKGYHSAETLYGS